jgi:hypothetical protein
MIFFICFEGIAKCFENLEYVKPLNEGIVSSTLGVFSMMRNIAKPTHLLHVVHMGGLDQTIRLK